jgi:hypothetical protein
VEAQAGGEPQDCFIFVGVQHGCFAFSGFVLIGAFSGFVLIGAFSGFVPRC